MTGFTRLNENLVKCDDCGHTLVSNRIENETVDHSTQHLSLRPFDISRSEIVWRDSKYAILRSRRRSALECKLVADMCIIGHKDESEFTTADLHSRKNFVLVDTKGGSKASVIGYVSYSAMRFESLNKKLVPTCRQIATLPFFRRRGYAKFLLLKTVQLQNAKIFVVDCPNQNSWQMLSSLHRNGFLRNIARFGIEGAPAYAFELVKAPTLDLIKQ